MKESAKWYRAALDQGLNTPGLAWVWKVGRARAIALFCFSDATLTCFAGKIQLDERVCARVAASSRVLDAGQCRGVVVTLLYMGLRNITCTTYLWLQASSRGECHNAETPGLEPVAELDFKRGGSRRAVAKFRFRSTK